MKYTLMLMMAAFWLVGCETPEDMGEKNQMEEKIKQVELQKSRADVRAEQMEAENERLKADVVLLNRRLAIAKDSESFAMARLKETQLQSLKMQEMLNESLKH